MEISDRIFGKIGQNVLAFFRELGEVKKLINQTLFWMIWAPFKKKGFSWKTTIEQMVRIGVESLPIVALIAFFVNTGREITKDIVDVKGDAVKGIKTIAISRLIRGSL